MKKSGLLIGLALLLSACTPSEKVIYIDRPEDTNLEFWITQRVNSIDLEEKGCTFLPGWFGASEYLDSRYAAIDDGSMLTAPEIHVTYLLTGYPDTLDERAITRIEITDPTITVYGLTLNSTYEEINKRMTGVADSISTENQNTLFKIRNCSFTFTNERILIQVPVTNKSGIVY